MSTKQEQFECRMKEPNIHPDCIAAGRLFTPEGWQAEKRAGTCKPCNSLRNAAYRVARAGGDEAAQEAARERARQGRLSPASLPSSRKSTSRSDDGAPVRRSTVLSETFETLSGSEVVWIGKDSRTGADRYRATPAKVDAVIDFTDGDQPGRGGRVCAPCPKCGKRGEFPKPGSVARVVTHRSAMVGGQPRVLEYCTLGASPLADALRESDRAKRQALVAREEVGA